jgi:hypothetical protein
MARLPSWMGHYSKHLFLGQTFATTTAFRASVRVPVLGFLKVLARVNNKLVNKSLLHHPSVPQSRNAPYSPASRLHRFLFLENALFTYNTRLTASLLVVGGSRSTLASITVCGLSVALVTSSNACDKLRDTV